MCNSLLPCPLCSVPRFNDLESLRVGLIKAATENLICPICKDVFMGLDKLTIHLFSHRESGLCTEKKKNITEPERQSAERKKSVDLFTNKTESQNEARESSFIKKKSKNKTKENNFNETSIDILNKSNNNNQNFPIFNMNALPFIGIPKNMPCEIQKNCRTRNSERRRNKNGLSEKCDICGFYFLGKNILEMHKKLIHNVHNSEVVNGVSQYCCHLCSKVFKMRGSLMVHLRMVHFRVIPSIENEESPVNYEENITKTENFNNDVMIQSNEINLPTKVEYEIANSEKLADSNEININGNKQWTCDICNKNFTTKYFLKKHKRLHTGEMPYSCVQCNKTFTFQQSYHKHLLYHNDDKPHTCSHCGRSFKELSTLHNHQRIHTGEKPFSCETCGKCFRQRVSYLVHRRIHTGVMPYKCTACDKSFRYKVSQRTHKCTAQPPGTVVRQSGDLVQKLIKNHIEIGNNTETHLQMSENFKSISEEKFDQHFSMTMNSSNENSISFSTMHQSDQFLDNVGHNSFSGSRDSDENFVDKIRLNEKNIIDEIVNESISKIDFSEPSTSHEYHNAVTDLYSMMSPTNDVEEDLPSPSEKLKDLKLSSPKENIAEGVDKNDFVKSDISDIFEMQHTDMLNSFVKDRNIEFSPNNLEYRNSIFTKR